MVTSF